MMPASIWKLHGKEIVFWTGLLAVAASFVVGNIFGIAALYLWFMYYNYLLWQEDRAPYIWIEIDAVKWALVLLGPLTASCILVAISVWILICPFLALRDARSREPINTKNWIIGIPIYYIVLSAVIFVIFSLVS